MTTRRNPRRTVAGSIPTEPRLRLREPVDVLAAIPYLVGYHPTESMILLGLRGTQLVFTARYDLPGPGASIDDAEESDSKSSDFAGRANSKSSDFAGRANSEIVEHMLQVVLRQRLTGVLIVGFGAEDQVRPLALTLRQMYERTGLDVLEVLRAQDGRYWSYLCGDPLCCPRDGSAYDPGTSEVAAEWTVAGRVALPDRETYEQQLTPMDGVARVAVRQETIRAHARLMELLARSADEDAASDSLVAAGNEAMDAALTQLRSGDALTDENVAWLSVLVASADVRDVAWARIRHSGDELPRHRTLWMEVMRRAERDLTPAPSCLFAFATWRCGEGALARLALEKALRVDPHCRMAQLLHHMLMHGLPPNAFDDMPDRRIKRGRARRQRRRSSSRRAGSRRG